MSVVLTAIITAVVTAIVSVFSTLTIVKDSDYGGKKSQNEKRTEAVTEESSVINHSKDEEDDYIFEDTVVTEADPYNGFPAPIELKLTGTNGRTNFEHYENFTVDIDSLHLIKDEDGYSYLVLNYSATNNSTDTKGYSGVGYPELFQNDRKLERYYYLSDECETAYDEIINDVVISDLRPKETVTATAVFEIYDTESSIMAVLTKDDIFTSSEYVNFVVREYSFE